jgi:hypothetical protein
MAIDFPANPSQGEIFTDPTSGNQYVCTLVGPPAQWVGAGSNVNLDDTYLKLDASNDPVTGDLDIGSGNILLNADGSAEFAGDAQVPSLNSGQLAGFRNQLINGDFRHWQRGTSFTSGGYTADRWLATGASGSTRTVSQYDTIETTGMQVVFVSGGAASSRTTIQQKIEDVRTFAGQEVTLSFEARSTNITQISTDVQQFFGSGGSPSATTTFGGKKHTGIENSWKKFSVTFNVPSVDGKTIGITEALDCLQVNFFLEAGSDFDGRTDSLGTQSGNIILRNVQLEPGPVATPFEHRPIGTELALCQRYYYVGNRLGADLMTSSDTVKRASYFFPTEMRVSPTVENVQLSGDSGSINNPVNSSRGGYFKITGATPSSDQSISANWTADAEL